MSSGGGAGGLGGYAIATITVTPGETLTLYVGGAGGLGGTANPGFNNTGGPFGGGGGSTSSGDGGGGGGASDVRQGGTDISDRVVVAGGGGGGGHEEHSGVITPYAGGAGGGTTGGSGATASSNTPATGGSQSAAGTGGGDAGGQGYGGLAFAQAGDVNDAYSSGGGGGGYWGGGAVATWGGGGGGSSFVPSGGSTTAGVQSGNGKIVLTYTYAIAPNVPTLTAPADAAYTDTSSGLVFTGTYNSTDSANANARAMRIKTSGGTYNYYNAATNALQSTEVWNAVSIAPAASASFTLPSALIPDGSVYNWSMADQESNENLQGPFASDFTVNAQTSPALTVNGPSGTVTSSNPQVSWTATPASGASSTAWQVRVFSAAQYEASGFDPGTSAATWDSGVTAGSASSVTVGAALVNGTTYRFYVQVTETGGQTSAWAYSSATVSLDPPAPPIVTAAQGVGPSGLPVAALTVQGTDNLLTAVDASFESGVGTWTGTANATVAQSAAEALDGSYSLAVTATAAGNAAVGTGDYAVVAGQTYSATAAVRAATTGRQVTLAVLWLNSSGTLISTTTGTAVTDTTSGWAVATASAAAPAGAVNAQLQVTVASAAASEVHYVDEAGIRPGTDPSWYRGGLVGTVQIVVTRDDGLEVRGASTANPAIMPAGQVLSLMDAEMVPTVGHTWTAVGTAVLGSTVSLSSGTSAASNQIALVTGGWWQFDPTDLTTAVSAQMTDYNPQITEQSTAHIVLGQTNPNIVASAMGGVDGAATFETFDVATYQGLSALLRSQKTVFISDPFGDNAGVTYVRFGPQTGGMSTGTGNKSKDAKLHPSTASAPHHEVSVTWIAQNRPAV